MAQAHLDRLTSIDAGFLHQEDRGAHMHIGGLGVFAGPAPTDEQLRRHIASRLQLVPRYRQKLVPMPFGTGRPVWADDARFRIGDHVRHVTLPPAGSDDQLLTLASRIVSQRLDRSKPLWELWLVDGLADGRFALVSKTHHAMIDGIGGVDLLTALLDLSPDPVAVPPQPWRPQPTPGTVTLLAHGVRGALRNVAQLGTRAAGLVTRPQRALREALGAAAALGAVAQPLIVRAPASPLNGIPGPHRRVEVVRTPLADYKQVKAAFGATVNDVVLTAVSGALGRYLADRGVEVDAGLQLRACVPVSVRTADKPDAAGNQITVMVAPLPVGLQDPVRRLAVVRNAMDRLKDSRQGQGAKLLATIENALPPVFLAHASRLGFSSRVYNLLVTNIPGPQLPIYLLGRELLTVAPLAFLSPQHLLAVAIMSYNGHVTYGLLGDADALPDLDQLARHVEESLAELVAAASVRVAASP